MTPTGHDPTQGRRRWRPRAMSAARSPPSRSRTARAGRRRAPPRGPHRRVTTPDEPPSTRRHRCLSGRRRAGRRRRAVSMAAHPPAPSARGTPLASRRARPRSDSATRRGRSTTERGPRRSSPSSRIGLAAQQTSTRSRRWCPSQRGSVHRASSRRRAAPRRRRGRRAAGLLGRDQGSARPRNPRRSRRSTPRLSTTGCSIHPARFGPRVPHAGRSMGCR